MKRSLIAIFGAAGVMLALSAGVATAKAHTAISGSQSHPSYSPCHWTPYPFPHKVCYYAR